VSSEGTQWVSVDDVPEEARQGELDIYRKQAADEGKPENIQQKIAEGRLDKWYTEVVLLRQPYFRDESKTVEDVRAALSAETGENIELKRFARYEVGQA
jgi:elongation factor Ts